MKKMKKHLAGLLTLVMMFSLLSLSEGLAVKAVEGTPQDSNFIYFDADNGKLYKETGIFYDISSSQAPSASEEYKDSSITCSGNQLTLRNFNYSLHDNNTAIVIKGNATINLIGENKITHADVSYPDFRGGYGICAYDNLSITGSGSLECSAHSDGIYTAKSLTVTNATILSVGGYFGIHSEDNFTMNSGSVTGSVKLVDELSPSNTSRRSGICSNKTIRFNGGTLVGDARVAASSIKYAFYSAEGINTISNTAFFNEENSTIQPQLMGNNYYIQQGQGLLLFLKLATKVTGIESTTSETQNLVIGESADLGVKVLPETASDQTIKWSSSDDSVVSVDENGKITAKKEGVATITATTQDGDYKKEFTITVSKAEGPAAPTGITAVAPTTAGGSDGKLVGVNNTMEYSTNKDFTDAKDCTGSEVTGLPAGTYYVRVKETDTTKAGAEVAVTVPEAGSSTSGNGTGTGSGNNGNPSQTEQSVMDSLGVSNDAAKQILDEAAKLGVSQDTLLITEASITSSKSDADLKGSTFGLLKARATNLKKNSITVKWSKVKNADGYIVYGNKCGAKNSYKKLKTIKKNSTCKFTQKKLKKGTYYKYLVVAYKKIAGTTVTIAAAKTIHATTTGGKYGVAKAVKVNKTNVTLARSKTFKIKASEIKQNKKIRQHRKIKYESSNKKIASVNGKGVVKAKKKGSCDIYVYAQNGVYKKIKITVK